MERVLPENSGDELPNERIGSRCVLGSHRMKIAKVKRVLREQKFQMFAWFIRERRALHPTEGPISAYAQANAAKATTK